jgi:hypothetical protein
MSVLTTWTDEEAADMILYRVCLNGIEYVVLPIGNALFIYSIRLPQQIPNENANPEPRMPRLRIHKAI